MLELSAEAYRRIIGHVFAGMPLEACGLLAGTGPDHGEVFYPTDNAAQSSRVYTVPPLQHLRAERAAEDAGMIITGVVHSHTHTDAFPSPTDVAAAPDPAWHYVIVSLRDESPSLRSFQIVDGNIAEEAVILYG